MNQRTFRRIALGMEGAIESSHMGHPDFRCGGRIFATLHADQKHGTVKLTPEQQAALVAGHPSMFRPAAGAWGRQGYTMVALAAADEDTVGEAITMAWQNCAQWQSTKPRTPSRGKESSRPTTRTKGGATRRTRGKT